MKVSIDPVLCEGNAVCEALAPTVFEVTGDYKAHILTDEFDESQRPMLESAVENCPRLAITITD